MIIQILDPFAHTAENAVPVLIDQITSVDMDDVRQAMTTRVAEYVLTPTHGHDIASLVRMGRSCQPKGLRQCSINWRGNRFDMQTMINPRASEYIILTAGPLGLHFRGADSYFYRARRFALDGQRLMSQILNVEVVDLEVHAISHNNEPLGARVIQLRMGDFIQPQETWRRATELWQDSGAGDNSKLYHVDTQPSFSQQAPEDILHVILAVTPHETLIPTLFGLTLVAENTDVTNAYCARLCHTPAWETQLLRDSRFDRLARTLDASFAIYSGYRQVGHDHQVGLMTGTFIHVQIHHRSRSQILHNLLDLLDEHGQSVSSEEISVASTSDRDQQDTADNNQPNSFCIRKPKRGSLSALWMIMTLGFASPKSRTLEVTIGLVMHMIVMQIRPQDQSTDSLPLLQIHITTSSTTTSSLMQSALQPVPQPSDFLNQRSHVLDRWCTFGDDIGDGILAQLHKQNVPGTDGDFIQVVEWIPQGPSPTTLPPDLEERSEDPDAAISTDHVTAATDAPMVFRTYGFFGEDAGQRDVQVNGDSLFTWKRKVLERWNDFGIAESLSTWVVRPHPPDAGIAAHIIVSRSNEVNGQLVLFEHSTLGLRSVVSCGVDDTGFQIAFRAGFAVRETQTARFRNEGRFHYGHLPLRGRHGQFWQMFVYNDDSSPGDGSESPDDTSFMQRPCPHSATTVKTIDKPTILQADDYGVDPSTPWTEIDLRWTTPCYGLRPTMPSDMEAQTYESNKWERKQNPRRPSSVSVDLSWNCRDDDSMDGCFRSFKPNPGILEGIDATVPYRHRTQDGFVFTGRTIPPPHWEQHPLLRSAANLGAVHRNADGELNVLIRSWIAARQEHLVLQHRDFTIRAQLMHEVESKIRQFWPDYILPDDLLTLTRVRPAPNIGHRGHRPLHILVEVNREDGSTWQPVLMANREINEHGPSNVIRWTPALVPPNIDLITVHTLCAPPCAAQQMLVPHPGRVRRWLEMGQNRQATAGLFLPLWWDRRLQIPQGDAYEEDDQHALLQTSSGEKDGYANCKLLDNWYEATILSMPQHLEREGEAQEDLAPILIIDEWEPLIELLAEPQKSPAAIPPHPVSIPNQGLSQGCRGRIDGEGDAQSSQDLKRPGSGKHQPPSYLRHSRKNECRYELVHRLGLTDEASFGGSSDGCTVTNVQTRSLSEISRHNFGTSGNHPVWDVEAIFFRLKPPGNGPLYFNLDDDTDPGERQDTQNNWESLAIVDLRTTVRLDALDDFHLSDSHITITDYIHGPRRSITLGPTGVTEDRLHSLLSPWPMDIVDVNFHSIPELHPLAAQYVDSAAQFDWEMIEALDIYCDGSTFMCPETETTHAGMSIVITGTMNMNGEGAYGLLGFSGGTLCMDQNSPDWWGALAPKSIDAERAGVLLALLWILQSDYAVGLPCTIWFDCTAAGYGASGQWNYPNDSILAEMLRGVGQLCTEYCPGIIRFEHTHAHVGDPANELADCAAKAFARGTLPNYSLLVDIAWLVEATKNHGSWTWLHFGSFAQTTDLPTLNED